MIKYLLIAISIFTATISFSQTIHSNYQDGKIWFKIKDKYFEKVLGDNDLFLLTSIIKEIPGAKLNQPFANTKSSLKLKLTYQLTFSEAEKVDVFIENLKRSEYIEYAERVPIAKPCLTTNDANYSSQWALPKIQAPQAWDIFSTGSNVKIAIIDDGVDLTHPDLIPNLWTNPGEIANNSIDDDGNGYIDDVNGFDVANNNGNPNPINNTYTHGTHLAGVASAASNNGIGISSIGFSCKIIAIRANLNSNSITNGYDGVMYAVAAGANVITLAWTDTGYSATAQNIIDYAYNSGCVVVAAAGNNGISTATYPAAYNHVVSVASTATTDVKSSFSNYGSWVDVSAPGNNIYSTLAGGTYGNQSGTSSASALVSGLAGLILSKAPGLNVDGVVNCILNNADNIYSISGNATYAGLLGSGRINANNSLTSANSTQAVVYKVPVVFHVLHQNGSEKISASQINDALSILNRDFNKQNADTINVNSSFANIIGKANIEFTLATKDPLGNCTNGIIYHDTLLTDWIKGDPGPYTGTTAGKWNPTKYLNIYTVKTISSGENAYTYRPGTLASGSANDAIMILSTHVGSIGTGNTNQSRILTHEVGHWLNLSHLWGNVNAPGVACGDDGVSDTPLTKGYSSCPANAAASEICNAGIAENYQNFMDYSYCSVMFTNGQVTRMRTAINSPTSGRNNLWSSANLSATGVTSPLVCIPTAEFTASSTTLCLNNAINFTDLSNNSPTSWSWSFPGGTPSSSTLQNPSVTYNSAGTYNVSLTVTNAFGDSTITKVAYITVNTPPTTSNAGSNITNGCFTSTNLNGNTPGSGTGVWSTIYTSNGSISIASPSNPNSLIGNFAIGDSVRLAWTIASPGCSSSVSYVSIKRINCPLTANFTSSSNTACVGSSITYTDASVASGSTITNWSWSFAGGTPSSATGPGPHIISYASSGTHNVSLQIQDNLASFDLEVKSVTINATPTILSSTPASRCGTGTVTLNATASAGTLNWYAASTGGSILGTGNNFTTPTISTTTTYYVDATSGNCTSARTAVTATINTSASITSTTPASRCDAGTVTLGATASSGTINWYANSSGGPSLATGNSYTTPTISDTTTYYVDATIGGCTSTRTAVTATVNTTPSIGLLYPGARCDAGVVTLVAYGGGLLNWYANSNGGPSLGTGTAFNTPSISTTTTFYVDVANGSCTSVRSSVLATVNYTPTILSTSPDSSCTPSVLTLGATASSGTINWYSVAFGGSSIATGTSYATPNLSTSTTYYVGASENGCASARTAVVASINNGSILTTTPSARCGTGTVTLGATTSGGIIHWYANSIGGPSLATGTSYTTPSISSTTTYYVEVDDNGCISPRIAVIATVGNTPPIVNIASTDTSVCQGNNITLSATGATTYQWSNGAQGANNTVAPVLPTRYFVTGTTNGCSATDSIDVDVLNSPLVTITSTSTVFCAGNTITLTANGANSYLWSTNDTARRINVSTNTTVNYIVTGTAANGCTAQANFLVSPVQIILNTSVTDVACNTSFTGQVNLSVSGGTGPYTFIWSDGSLTEDLVNVPAGNYTVTVNDDFGCSNNANATVGQSTSISITTSVNAPACGANNGVITASVSGGTSPYQYLWSNGDRSNVADSLASGTYHVEVYDANNCYASAFANINASDGPVISTNISNNVTCHAGNNGSISISLSGGQSPYTIAWTNGSNATSLNNLTAGVYDVYVTDNVGCSSAASYQITEPAGISITQNLTLPDCGINNGSISIVATGGIAPYTYTWSSNANGNTTANPTNLYAGYYSVVITSASGCSQYFGFSLNNNTSLNAYVAGITASSCGLTGNGAININVNGGVSPFTYQWNTTANTQDLNNILPGDYYVSVTDSENCVVSVGAHVPSVTQNYTPEICMATVDTSNNTNELIWQKTIFTGIDRFKIYRETSIPGYFQLIGQVPFNNLSHFVDTVANVNLHSWKYKISAVDSCGIEGPQSNDHKTIHLSTTLQTGYNQLNWDYYTGFSYPKFYIQRHDQVFGGWHIIDSTATASTNTYIDTTTIPGTIKYFVEAKPSFDCTPLRIANNNGIMAATITKTKSNIKNQNRTVNPTGIRKLINIIKVYPNPAHDKLFIKVEGESKNINVSIQSVTGQLMFKNNYSNGLIEINTEQFAKGIYFIKIEMNAEQFVKKIVVN